MSTLVDVVQCNSDEGLCHLIAWCDDFLANVKEGTHPLISNVQECRSMAYTEQERRVNNQLIQWSTGKATANY